MTDGTGQGGTATRRVSSGERRAKDSPTPGARLGKKDCPYPGLRFYRDDREEDILYFAGRDEDIRSCAKLLETTRILLLHGGTGCGKSSFLRAGLKPYLARAGSPIAFANGPGAFTVVRSTWDPMSAFAKELLNIADAFCRWNDEETKEEKRRREGFGEARSAFPKERMREMFPRDEEFRIAIHNEPQAAVDALRALVRAMKTAPIIVIDQGEEVFTQSSEALERAKRRLEKDPKSKEWLLERDKAKEAEQSRQDVYFRFLHLVSISDVRTRVIVSMRTEYKGRFDDRVTADEFSGGGPDRPERKLVGFHLKELDEKALTEAILRPTIQSTSPEWAALKRNLALSDKAKAPGDRTGALSLESGVAEELARRLLTNKVPVGGILPALQTTCIRLWEQSAAMSNIRKVQITDLRRLGDIENQVQEHLVEKVQEACEQVKSDTGVTELARKWLRTMGDLLVHVEADGRAVGQRVEPERFLKGAPGAGGPIATSIYKHLTDPDCGIMRIAKGDDGEDKEYITLLHDSLALALHKLSLSFPSEGGMMMRMGMANSRTLSLLTKNDLFLEEEQPHEASIVVPLDYNWDRFLPGFAQKKHLAERLGITIEENDALDASRRPQNVPDKKWNWATLREKIIEHEKAWEEDTARFDPKLNARRRCDGDNERMVVAAEFMSFPGAPPSEKQRHDPTPYAFRWSDLMVSNLFVGNGVIGVSTKFAERLAEAYSQADRTAGEDASFADAGGKSALVRSGGKDRSERTTLSAAGYEHNKGLVDEIRKIVVEALAEMCDKVEELDGQVRCRSDAAVEFLEVAAHLCGEADLRERIRDLRKRNGIISLQAMPYEVSDPLVFGFLLNKKVAAPEEARFVVGVAETRAMAHHCGFSTYFGAKELAILAAHEMKRRQQVDHELNKREAEAKTGPQKDEVTAARKKEDGLREALPGDLAATVQKIVSHTVWNVSMPAASWRQGVNRAFTLRLASIGYFTSEFVRSNMEDFVSHVSEKINARFDRDEVKADVQGQKLPRKWVKEAISDCFLFLKFDEFGPEIFDLDSRFAYWSEHGRLQTRSVAGEIYQELCDLRQRTLAAYQECAEAIAWLRYGRSYDPRNKDVRLAFRLKELAWNNFNIFNFYDSERLMRRAADLLSRHMEDDFKQDRKN